jgi:uncharacterized protein (DUF1697 family)
MGYTDVETFIASGNVVFTSPARSGTPLEPVIAAALEQALGYEVATFVRSVKELREIADYRPFPETAVRAPGASLYIGFLAEPLSPAAAKALLAMRTRSDDLMPRGREVYWLGRRGFAEAEFSTAQMEKKLKTLATFRNSTTVRKMAAKLAPAEE